MARKTLDDARESDAGTEQPLHIKYRPTELSELVGQEHIAKSLAKVLDAPNRPHSYLLVGPSGCGKTTIARIVARAIEASANNVIEIDAATNTGIDAMREVTDTLHYKGFGSSASKMVIVDEAHALSKAAWQSLLKILEEPPPHVYFALCTTEVSKVPDTVQTRCVKYTVKELSGDDLFEMLEDVCKRERIDVSHTTLDVVVRRAEGSARKALTALACVVGARDAKEAAALLEQPMEQEDIVNLMRGLVSNRLRWDDVVRVLRDNKDMDPESIRLLVVNYVAAVLLKADAKSAPRLLDILDQFSKPCNRSEKMAPILLSFGAVLFAN